MAALTIWWTKRKLHRFDRKTTRDENFIKIAFKILTFIHHKNLNKCVI